MHPSLLALYIALLPFLEPLLKHLVQFLDVRKAADFLEISATKIIEGRKKESNKSAMVTLNYICLPIETV